VNVASLAAGLDERMPGRVERAVPSATLTTYRCGGPLAVLVRVHDEAELGLVAEHAAGVPVLVVGRGSNLLVADSGFPGVAILLAGALEAVEPDPGAARVVAGGGAALPVVARRAGAAGIGGLEFYVGIPGSVGGAVRMNAGGHGRDTAEVLVEARVFDLTSGRSEVRRTAGLGLGYRTSALAPGAVVTGATFAGVPEAPAACAARIDDIVRWRRGHQPGGQNAGSVFKNPPGDAAGRLIEAAGAKGLKIGGVRVSEKHANFFVAEPGARAADVVALMREIRRRVADRLGVDLEPELHLVGFPEEER
jgi:UDP-N-acetylmuramate dehydrogenase